MAYSNDGATARTASSDTLGRPVTPIRTPDQRLRVFVSSTLQELADERQAVRRAISNLRLAPVLFELGARPHPPQELYRAYLEQSHIFIGVYWQRYGWVAPGMDVSGLEDEYRLSGDRPKLIYVKSPAPEREDGLARLLTAIKNDDSASYKQFRTAEELQELVENDLALLLTERFERVAGDRPGADYSFVQGEAQPLPRPATPLVGRDLELDRICGLLLRDDVRMVTLCGPGGIGKTRLSLEVGERLRTSFDDGVSFVPLAPIRDPANVPGAIAQALGIVVAPGLPVVASLGAFLRDKRMLLILDNFEQVLDAATVVAELLTASAGLKVMVTSRAILRLSFEHEHDVPPLELPVREEELGLERARASEAVTLFTSRARAVQPAFELDERNLVAVAEICRRLDGLPLAIELAAARVKFLTPAAILKRLDRRLDLLTGGERDRPDRQQTLRGAIDWSFRLLSAQEQLVFTRAGLFVGGFSLEAAEYMNADVAGIDIVEILFSLSDKSLLKHQLGDDEPRFHMLETVREFALEKLDALDDAAALRDRHVAYFRQLSERAGVEIRGHRQREWLDLLERENANLRAALRHSLLSESHTAAVMGWNLWPFWWVRGDPREGRKWMEQTLARASELDILERARARFVLGAMAVVQGDYQAAMEGAQECLELSREAGDRFAEALGLLGLGLVALYRGELADAGQALGNSLDIFRDIGDWWGQAHVLHYLWRLAAVQGLALDQLDKLEESAALFRANGDRSGLVLILHNLAMACLVAGDHSRAAALLDEAIEYSLEVRHRWYVAYCLEGWASLAVDRGRPELGASLFGFAERIRERVHSPVAPADGALYAPYLEALAANPDWDDLMVAWKEGREWSLTEAQAKLDVLRQAVAASAAL